jgi:pimeloyl-ACP methyl ester carboxylesterase
VSELRWERLETRRGASCRVLTGGSSGDEALVFFHGASGLERHEPLLERLAERGPVFAPELPGYGESTGEDLLEDMLDFTLHGWDVVDALGLARPHLAGHSMGAMMAAEMACVAGERPRSLSLIAPAGLWLDAHPVPDIFTTLPMELPALLFHDETVGSASLTGGTDFTDMEALVQFYIGNAKRLGTAGKLLFPIPNRRLSKRLYRLQAPTLLVFAANDRLYPEPYADRWQELVPEAQLVTVADAGHLLTIEQPDAVADAVTAFLNSELAASTAPAG